MVEHAAQAFVFAVQDFVGDVLKSRQLQEAMHSAAPAMVTVAQTAPPLPPSPSPAPAQAVPAAPIPIVAPPAPATAATTPASASSAIAGKRVAIKMVSQCPSDPDPLGFLPGQTDFYSDCAQEELDKVRNWISSSLTDRHLVGAVVDDGAQIVLTVTITKDMDDRSGAFTDFGSGTMKLEANYQLTDAAGHVLQSGTVSHQASDESGDADEGAFEQQFAVKIADAAIAASTATGGAR